MGLKDSSIDPLMGAKRQTLTALRTGVFANFSNLMFDQVVKAAGKIVDCYAIPRVPNGAATTLSIIPYRASVDLAAPLATDAPVPLIASATGLQIPASGVAGVKVSASLAAEGEEAGDIGKADAGGASTIDLQTGLVNAAVAGYYSDCLIEIISGTGLSQKRTGIAYDHNTNQRLTVNSAWATQPDNTSMYRITRRNRQVKAGDWLYADGTLAGGNPGTDVLVVAIVEFDERIS